ncbi:MAG: filamentous hemagglutinin N-terminal domain-containing protein [Cyanophyceae cyanobacterium]
MNIYGRDREGLLAQQAYLAIAPSRRRCWLLRLGLMAVVGALTAVSDGAEAQIAPDDSLAEESSVVTPAAIRGTPSDRIDGGAQRGANLFHSFQDFNVGEGRGAYFSTPDGVENIFSRVTGGSPSDILGTLGVLGEANLLLINPNGILFGPNASLDVNGSFVGTTANGIRFGEEDMFSATNPEIPSQLLSVNPAALFFNQVATQPHHSIAVQGNLAVPTGQSLLLVGGTVSPTPNSTGSILVDGGALLAPGGRVELGGLAAAGTIGIREEGQWQLSFPREKARPDVALSNEAAVSVLADDGGSIVISAGSLEILGGSFLLAGIGSDLGASQVRSGNIDIQTTETVTLTDQSIIANVLEPGALGKGGNINISTGSLSVFDGARLVSNTVGQGNAGSIAINASESVAIEGRGEELISGVLSIAGDEAVGNAGSVTITTDVFSVTDGAGLDASTYGQGNAGSVFINASESVAIEGRNEEIFSGILGDVAEGAEGNGGNITINTGSLSVTHSGLSTSTYGRGNAGSISINASDVVLDNGVAFSNVSSQATGNGGSIDVNTGALSVTNNAQLSASTFGRGNTGNITINASESITLNNGVVAGFVSTGAEGNGGSIEITTGSLTIADGATIGVNTAGRGDAGSISIHARESVAIEGSSEVDTTLFDGLPGEGDGGRTRITTGSSEGSNGEAVSAVFGGVLSGAEGDGGKIEITTQVLSIADGAGLAARTFGRGDAGSITINASESVTVNDGRIFNGTEPQNPSDDGNAGDISITTSSLRMTNGAVLDASTFGRGNAGDITIDASESVVIEGKNEEIGSTLLSVVGEKARGNGGEIKITTDSLAIANEALLSSGTLGSGNAGSIIITANFLSLTNGAQINSRSLGSSNSGEIGIQVLGTLQAEDGEISTSSTQATGGAIDITAGDIRLRGDSDILTEVASGAGGGGDITLTANSIVLFDDSDVLAFARDGQGGDIRLDTPVFFGSRFQPAPESTDLNPLDGNESVNINASGAVSGEISLPDVSFLHNSPSELPVNVIDTETLIANSCVVPRDEQRGTFIITGAGGLPVRPGEASVSAYPTGTIQTVPNQDSSSHPDAAHSWQYGNPIIEPTGTYRLASGQLILSRLCSQP